MTRNGAIALRIAGWVALLPLLFLNAVCLVKRAVWSALIDTDSGLRSQHALLTHATHMANLWLSLLVTAEITATVLLFILLPARLRLFRFIISVLAVPLITGATAYMLIIVSHPH